MGWNSCFATKYMNGKIDVKAECDDLFTQNESDEFPRQRVLCSEMVDDVYYAAVERSQHGSVECVFAVVVLTETREKERMISYKGMDETECPKAFLCPRSILSLLSATDNTLALRWREECNRQAL